MKISPSVLAGDFSRLYEEVAAMERAGADMIHLDVMDGHFVPNITFGAPVIKCLRPKTDMVFDVHLMISDPLTYIPDFLKAGADIITFHVECGADIAAAIRLVKDAGKRVGLVLKPATPMEALLPYLDTLAMVVVMTVEPGFGGQKFMADQMDKLAAVKGAIDRTGRAIDLEVDGGIDPATAPVVAANGANVLVAGSAIFGKPDYAQAIRELRESVGH